MTVDNKISWKQKYYTFKRTGNNKFLRIGEKGRGSGNSLKSLSFGYHLRESENKNSRYKHTTRMSTCEMDSINNFLGKSLQTFESTSRSRKFEADRDSCTFIEKSYSQKIKGYYRHKCLAGKEHFFPLAMTLID